MSYSADDRLPKLTPHGHLPEGIHETTLEDLKARFATNARREFLWEKLKLFLDKAVATGNFSAVYIDGGYVTNKAEPEDIDLILQTRVPFGADAFRAMEPFFVEGLVTIYEKYSVHLHFWCEGFPSGMSDFRQFFQYLRPQEAAPLGLREGAKKGIVKIAL